MWKGYANLNSSKEKPRLLWKNFKMSNCLWYHVLTLATPLETWFIDSGCTNHMTYDQGLFKEIDKTVTSKVIIGNRAYLVVKGKGTVAIEGHTGLKLISNVLYIP